MQEELVNLKDIPNSLAVFCLATYGEGDPTDNAMEFYEWLQNGDANLAGLNYAVSGGCKAAAGRLQGGCKAAERRLKGG